MRWSARSTQQLRSGPGQAAGSERTVPSPPSLYHHSNVGCNSFRVTQGQQSPDNKSHKHEAPVSTGGREKINSVPAGARTRAVTRRPEAAGRSEGREPCGKSAPVLALLRKLPEAINPGAFIPVTRHRDWNGVISKIKLKVLTQTRGAREEDRTKKSNLWPQQSCFKLLLSYRNTRSSVPHIKYLCILHNLESYSITWLRYFS